MITKHKTTREFIILDHHLFILSRLPTMAIQLISRDAMATSARSGSLQPYHVTDQLPSRSDAIDNTLIPPVLKLTLSLATVSPIFSASSNFASRAEK